MNYYDNIIKKLKNESFTERRTGKIRKNLITNPFDEGLQLRVNCWMEDDEWDYLKSIAESYGITLSTILKVILKDFVKKHKQSDALFKRFGI